MSVNKFFGRVFQWSKGGGAVSGSVEVGKPFRSKYSGVPGGGKFIDPQVLMRIKSLEFRARKVVEGFRKGLHRSPYHGFSAEFTEYRSYVEGDDLRFLDWKVYGRSDRYYVKKFEEETNLASMVLLDGSGSMLYGSGGYSKLDYAKTLAATFGRFLEVQGEGVGLISFSDEVGEVVLPRRRGQSFYGGLEQVNGGAGTEWKMPLEMVERVMKRKGVVFLISDLLGGVEAVKDGVSRLVAYGHEVVVFHVLDRAEVEFSFEDESVFEDLESGEELRIQPNEVREEYLEKFRAYGDEVKGMCDGFGVRYQEVVSDEFLELVLYDFLKGCGGKREVGQVAVG